MPWETRRNGRFFYLGCRENGRVAKRYLGRGPAAAAAAEAIKARAQERVSEHKTVAELSRKTEPADQAMDSLDQYLETLTEATLLASGYHDHKGAWRKARAKKSH